MNSHEVESEFHFHLYYEVLNIDRAEILLNQIQSKFNVKVGRLWDRPVGPHPIGSCQITVVKKQFEEICLWLMKYRNDIDIFIHPVTGDDLRDHEESAMWLGRSYKLKLEIFR